MAKLTPVPEQDGGSIDSIPDKLERAIGGYLRACRLKLLGDLYHSVPGRLFVCGPAGTMALDAGNFNFGAMTTNVVRNYLGPS